MLRGVGAESRQGARALFRSTPQPSLPKCLERSVLENEVAPERFKDTHLARTSKKAWQTSFVFPSVGSLQLDFEEILPIQPCFIEHEERRILGVAMEDRIDESRLLPHRVQYGVDDR
jgi:hypothetical protein